MSKAQIMVVEDEFVVAVDIQEELENLGYEVANIECSAEEAVEKVEEIKPDLVLMDVILRGKMDGIEAAEQIRSRCGIPVVYLTACTDEEILERAKITEPFGYLVKPFSINNLRSAIEMALHKAKVERRREELIRKLQDELARNETLDNNLCICFSCKKIRIGNGRWDHIEEYIRQYSQAGIKPGICPDCEKNVSGE